MREPTATIAAVTRGSELFALHDVEPARRAGVAQDRISAQRRQHEREHRRPKALSPREALAALHFECLVLWTAWANLRAGVELSDEDAERITIAMARVDALAQEAL